MNMMKIRCMKFFKAGAQSTAGEMDKTAGRALEAANSDLCAQESMVWDERKLEMRRFFLKELTLS